MISRGKYSISQIITMAILIIINMCFMGWFLKTIFEMYFLNFVVIGDVYQKTMNTVICVYSLFASLYLIFRFFLIKLYPNLLPEWIATVIVTKIESKLLPFHNPQNIMTDSREEYSHYCHERIAKWVNPSELFIFTVIHVVCCIYMGHTVFEQRYLHPEFINLINIILPPVSILIYIFTTIFSRNTYTPKK